MRPNNRPEDQLAKLSHTIEGDGSPDYTVNPSIANIWCTVKPQNQLCWNIYIDCHDKDLGKSTELKKAYLNLVKKIVFRNPVKY